MPGTVTHADLHRLSTPVLMALQRRLTLALSGYELGSPEEHQTRCSLAMISQVLTARRAPRPPGL